MILVAETTQWAGDFPNHVYLLSNDKSKMYGYAKHGESSIYMMKKPIGFDTRHRKFITLYQIPEEEQEGRKVVGSKGDVYYVLDGKCTCQGFKYRGECKHV
jgi:predicted ribosome-associated RNA-binding protein Tma20